MINFKPNAFLFPVLLATLFLFPLTSEAQTVGLDSTSGPGGAVSLGLGPGVYDMRATSGGWNAWGGDVDLPEFGWLCNATMRLNGVDHTGIGSNAAESPAAAIASCSTAQFDVCPNDIVDFYIWDAYYEDNVGGLTLSITQTSTDQPSRCPEKTGQAEARQASQILSTTSQAIALLNIFNVAGTGVTALNSILGELAMQYASAAPAAFGAFSDGVSPTNALGAAFVQTVMTAIFTAASVGVAVNAGGVVATVGFVSAALSGSLSLASIMLQYYANDPPDFDYYKVFESQYVEILPPESAHPLMLDALPVINSTNRLSDALFVIIRSKEKLDGALIDAEAGADTAQYQAIQLAQIAKYSLIAAEEQGNLSTSSQILQNTFSSYVDSIDKVSEEEYSQIIMRALTDPLPIELAEVLEAEGIEELDYRQVAYEALQIMSGDVREIDVTQLLNEYPEIVGEMVAAAKLILGEKVVGQVEADVDGDGVPDLLDNCALIANSEQSDFDNDQIGDTCDEDIDGDGVANGLDSCGYTETLKVVNVEGCSIDQICPCEKISSVQSLWKNHGAYVSCHARVSNEFVVAGLITESEKDELQSEAAESKCGI